MKRFFDVEHGRRLQELLQLFVIFSEFFRQVLRAGPGGGISALGLRCEITRALGQALQP